jgi:hypothetical protein
MSVPFAAIPMKKRPLKNVRSVALTATLSLKASERIPFSISGSDLSLNKIIGRSEHYLNKPNIGKGHTIGPP